MRHLFTILAFGALVSSLLFGSRLFDGQSARAAPGAKASKEEKVREKAVRKITKAAVKRLRAAGSEARGKLRALSKAVRKGQSLDEFGVPSTPGAKHGIQFTIPELDAVVTVTVVGGFADNLEVTDDIFRDLLVDLDAAFPADDFRFDSRDFLPTVSQDFHREEVSQAELYAVELDSLRDAVLRSSQGTYEFCACVGEPPSRITPFPTSATSTVAMVGPATRPEIRLVVGTSTERVLTVADPSMAHAFATTPPAWQLNTAATSTPAIVAQHTGAADENVVTFSDVPSGVYTVNLGVTASAGPVFFVDADIHVPEAAPDEPVDTECSLTTSGTLSLRGDLTIDRTYQAADQESAFVLLENNLLSQILVVFTDANGQRVALSYLPEQLSPFQDTYTVGASNASEISLTYQELNTEVLVSAIPRDVAPDFTIELCIPDSKNAPTVGQRGVSVRISGTFGWVDRFDSGTGTVDVQFDQVDILDEFPF